MIGTTLGVSMALFAIVISFISVQQQLASAQPAPASPPPANPAGSNMTGPAANTTGGALGANIWPPH